MKSCLATQTVSWGVKMRITGATNVPKQGYTLNNMCVARCDPPLYLHAKMKKCISCHSQCAGGCFGSVSQLFTMKLLKLKKINDIFDFKNFHKCISIYKICLICYVTCVIR